LNFPQRLNPIRILVEKKLELVFVDECALSNHLALLVAAKQEGHTHDKIFKSSIHTEINFRQGALGA
jgi:hypothetical protein